MERMLDKPFVVTEETARQVIEALTQAIDKNDLFKNPLLFEFLYFGNSNNQEWEALHQLHGMYQKLFRIRSGEAKKNELFLRNGRHNIETALQNLPPESPIGNSIQNHYNDHIVNQILTFDFLTPETRDPNSWRIVSEGQTTQN